MYISIRQALDLSVVCPGGEGTGWLVYELCPNCWAFMLWLGRN